jgi:uncharacterized membrane-anchored protein YitT (DUF2179 family)
VLEAIREIDAEAFITVEPISHASGGWLPESASPTSLKK